MIPGSHHYLCKEFLNCKFINTEAFHKKTLFVYISVMELLKIVEISVELPFNASGLNLARLTLNVIKQMTDRGQFSRSGSRKTN